MSNIIQLSKRRKEVATSFNNLSELAQAKFEKHEIRAIGDIQSCLVQIGFSQNPTMTIKAFPDKTSANNIVVLDVDVANPYYQSIFGERFNISVAKYNDKSGRPQFTMETPIYKTSGTFCEVIGFVENFINTNLQPTDGRVKTLVASL